MHPALLALTVLGTPLVALSLATKPSSSSDRMMAPQDDSKHAPVRPQEGDTAALVRLNDQAGQAVSLGGDHSSKNSEWTVVAFFPKAATPG